MPLPSSRETAIELVAALAYLPMQGGLVGSWAGFYRPGALARLCLSPLQVFAKR